MRYARIFIILYVLLSVLCVSAFADDLDSGEYVSESYEMLTLSADPESGSLKDVLLTFVGDYEPIVKDYVYQSQDGRTQHSITISPDWSWICSCGVLVVFCYIVFRSIGVVFKDVIG